MWVFEQDQYGPTDNKFSLDNPNYVPRVGEFISHANAFGKVELVQYEYKYEYWPKLPRESGFELVIMVYLEKRE